MKKNILITSAGRRVSLVRAFQEQVKRLLGPEAKVFTTDLNPSMSAACRLSDGSFPVGYFKDEDYMPRLLELCLKAGVAMVIPTLDPELQLYSEWRDKFLDEGIHIVVSDPAFVSVCRDKFKMNDFFAERSFLVPALVDINNPVFPLFIKPRNGSSSKNIMLVKDESMLSRWMREHEDFMHMEYLSPEQYEEYTVDLYYDVFGALKCTVPRIRLSVRGGETNKGITVKQPHLLSFINDKISRIKGARGCLTLQVFLEREGDRIYGIEINPRFGGGYPLSYHAGANYPAWIIQEYLLNQPAVDFEGWKNHTLLLRYDYEHIVENYEYGKA